jgi:hypothetical protein
MPYALIAVLAALAATGWFALATGASSGAKALVAAACACSIALPYLFPQWALVGLLLQALLVIGVVLYAKMHPSTRPVSK